MTTHFHACDEKYRIAVENSFDTIVMVDNQAIVQYASPSLESLVGYKASEYEGMDAFEALHPDDQDRVREAHQAVMRTGQPVEVKYRLVHRQGYLVYVEVRVKPVIGTDGSVQSVVAVVRDVSDQVKTEQLLQNLLNHINAMVWSGDQDFNQIAFVSDSIEKVTGLPKEEYLENPIRIHDNLHPEDNEMLFHEVKDLLDAGVHVEREVRMIHGSETRWLRMIAHPYVEHAGMKKHGRVDGMFLDITNQKLAERALEESVQRYKSLFENNVEGVISSDVFGIVENVNASFLKIVGRSADELIGHQMLHLILEEDQPLVEELIIQVMTTSEPRTIECRICHSNGVPRISTVTLVPILLAGTFHGIHGIVKDITDRKQEEMELIQSEKRHRILQQSINRFTSDLANVMRVSELEQRLLDEVGTVLMVTDLSIVEGAEEEQDEQDLQETVLVSIGRKHIPVALRLTLNQPLTKLEQEWLETIVQYARILYDNLQLIEDLMLRVENTIAKSETPTWLLRLFFKLSERERSALSSDLHDAVLQDLIIWYRRLESMRSRNSFANQIADELKRIEDGILDAIHQIRITCNELRPPFLLKLGLIESVKSLLDYTKMFANYEIDFTVDHFACKLNEEQVLGLYRIVQELLSNASKHSQASRINMDLRTAEQQICFTYLDDGVGFDLASHQSSFQNMGLSGIEKRVLSLDGEIEMRSSPHNGFNVQIKIPVSE